MALNIKNAEVDRLAAEVARMSGETKTEAIRKALEERRARLAQRITVRKDHEHFRRFLEREIWPLIPPGVRGKAISKNEREEILGIGPEGH